MAAFIPDSNNRNSITLRNDDGSSITVYEQGAHLSSWKSTDGVEHLYLSPKAIFEDRKALRGGVPIIFPQFGGYGPMLPVHGFARIRPWKIEDSENGRATFSLHAGLAELFPEGCSLSDSPQNAVKLLYTIHFSNMELKLTMKVTNTSEEREAPFQFAFHTYFAVEKLHRTVVNGVNRSPYVDNNESKGDPKAKVHQPEPLWIIREEHDRVYPGQHCAILLQDLEAKRAIQVSTPNLPDVCIWNPGPEKCAALKDMPSDGYQHFVCVEHGNMLKQVVVPPNSSWTGTQVITILPGSPADAKM
ncbi:aldose 1-epimerase-like protein [Leptomonas pyrrhocoris]|uniref:glucose-6-phosphate 1-epimerase n=1 Tax=Leptomonas pyrrhocoris TaxID=157538 RepID=A0A0N0DX21_LEPPY|nr:aldose 1-epimerase-like protein [Leptomonas pyrrhocoris]XP_015660871.1 aldose 1-epimerase-like protein [Leptomonas pyrrhocoris]KPA82431.1 aldose 1-epimerase-like protein [Leptomonas pyrrhocoris]KPA82432.1 aldose 1-epimerase-like protein [Leptomonas pyrrhocoris]|eukprot:XP_015660870.1 aldose 1-epimerase-like protein [Leptomonas pyrrhocoris]